MTLVADSYPFPNILWSMFATRRQPESGLLVVGEPDKKKLYKKAKRRQRDLLARALEENGHHKRENDKNAGASGRPG